MRKAITYTALVVTILLSGMARSASAQSTCAGCPDLSFGPKGIVPIPSFGGAIGNIGIQHIAGEELVVALDTYRWTLARYRLRAQGGVELDATFGTAGLVTHPNSRATANSGGMVVQSDNKLVVVGALRGRNYKEPWVLIVVRYNEDGSVDSSFGKDGTVTFPSYGRSQPPRLQSDGKLLLAIGVYPGNTHVIRLNTNGTADTTFGQNGFVILQGLGTAQAIAAAPDDKIVVATSISRPTQETDPVTGEVIVNSHYVASLIRLDHNGSLDESFGDGGKLERDEPTASGVSFYDVVVDGTGGAVVGGSVNYRINEALEYETLVERYDAYGHHDFTFKERDHHVMVKNVTVGPDGKILAVGLPMPTFSNSRGLGVWRLLDSGAADTTFGAGGLMFSVTVDPFSSMWPGFDGGPHVALLDNGTKFLVGGSAYVQQSRRVVTDVGALGRFHY